MMLSATLSSSSRPMTSSASLILSAVDMLEGSLSWDANETAWERPRGSQRGSAGGSGGGQGDLWAPITAMGD